MNRSPRLSFISPNILAVQFDVGSVERGIGTEADRFVGEPLAEGQLYNASNYTLTSLTDPSFTGAINPLDNITLKAKTTDVAFLNKFNRFDPNQIRWAQEYTVYLTLPEDQALARGESYTLDFAGNLETAIADLEDFTFQPTSVFSEAIHVSQIGFDPGDPKVAFLSQWLGTDRSGAEAAPPVNFETGQQFWIVDAGTGERIEGTARRAELSLAATEDEDVREGFQNYSGTDVYQLDFSDFTRAGEYFIEVDGVGRSFDFEIAENTWERAFQVSMQGLYNQRSGTAIGGQYSETEYQRSFHPDDGVRIFATDARTIIVNGEEISLEAVQLTDTTEGEFGELSFVDAFADYVTPFDQDDNGDVTADELAQELTPLEDAWGGYKDAGDWDRRIQHLGGTRQHLELLELFPDYFETVDLNIPETTDSFATLESLNAPNPDNGIPDILNESLWSLDFFRRLQTEEGGIRGGIESAAAPRPGETSWQESLNVFAYAADPWSSYIYAGVAARAARILKNYSANLASLYEESAIRAANWAEAEVPTDSKYDLNEIRDERNLAALELYLLTEDNQWNDIFLSNTVFAGEACTPGQACADVFEFEGHDQQQAAFLYARAPENLTDATIRGNAAQAIERAAANSLAVQNGGTLTSNNLASQSVNGTGFKWTKNRPFTPLVSAQLATPQVDALLQAHTLTGNSEYLEGAVLGSQFGAGANPSNTVFTSGLSKIGLADREARNPFVIDARVTGQATPSGITSYGPIDSTFGFSGFQTDLFRGDTSPQPELWPTAEAFFDNYWNFQNSEFTIHESIAPTAYTWGYLAASDFDGSSGPVDQVITGTAGPDNLSGADGDDSIFGGAGNDTLQGGAGSDTLQAGAGNDNLDGGSGNDLIIIRNFKGIDSFDGGADNDTLRLRPTDDRNLRIFMAQGAIGDQRRGGQFFDNFERVVSGGGDDHLIGDASNNYLNGGYGNDTLVGGKGHDTLIGSNGVDTFQFGNELLDGVEDTDTVQNFKAQDALNFDDYLGAGGTIEFTRVATDLLTVNLSNEDVVNISGGQGALAVAENQLTALS